MLLATIYPEPAKTRCKGSSPIATIGQGVTVDRLSKARVVYKFGRDDLAPLVLNGSQTLDKAFAEGGRDG